MSLEILCRLGTHLDSKDAIIILLYFLFSHLNGSSVALLVMLWLQRIEVTPIFNHRRMPLSHHLNTLSRPELIPPPRSLSAPAIDSETFPPNTNPNGVLTYLWRSSPFSMNSKFSQVNWSAAFIEPSRTREWSAPPTTSARSSIRSKVTMSIYQRSTIIFLQGSCRSLRSVMSSYFSGNLGQSTGTHTLLFIVPQDAAVLLYPVRLAG